MSDMDLTPEQSSLIETIMGMSGDDLTLANRILSRGTDPLSIQLLAFGYGNDHIRKAHGEGPGGLAEGWERDDWLHLASLSLDEAKNTKPDLAQRIYHLVRAADHYETRCRPRDRREPEVAARIEEKRAEIEGLHYRLVHRDGWSTNTSHVETRGTRTGGIRCYNSDLGFASAFWQGCGVAAVEDEEGLLFIGARSPNNLLDVGIPVDKEITPSFGIIFPKEGVERVWA